MAGLLVAVKESLLAGEDEFQVLARCITTSARLLAQVQRTPIPKLSVPPGSLRHNCLQSFLDDAERRKVNRTCPTFRGTHYEYTVADALERFGFKLDRVGRRNDAGIDLVGYWHLPQFAEPIPVIVQCKGRFTRALHCSPTHIRELEGSFSGAPAEFRGKPVLGLLVTSSRATRGVQEALGMSPKMLGFLDIEKDGTIGQLIWNRAAADRGLQGLGVTLRHTPLSIPTSSLSIPKSALEPLEQGAEGTDWAFRKARLRNTRFKAAGTKTDIQLTWMGEPIFPDQHGLGAGATKKTAKRRTTITKTTDALKNIKTTKRKIPVAKTKVASSLSTKTPRRCPTAAKSLAPKTSRKAVVNETEPAGGSEGQAAVQVCVALTQSAKAVLAEGPRKRGRPKGSKNKVSMEVPAKRGRPKGSKNKVSKMLADNT
ncbi:hypothetical protein M011DRAFT_481969 [Sporormia fimetaria CBS 119925]|uniref:Restriction endonuclease type IV Mrr domain-containing protein n=1 Tax=Sporormia fimetaria CBS 119925 TaxID=1340428 RepID=A0A6A6UWF3_9PLEO|nr:hypothetical protein M011DRAFT_481969 [Sporormia fimetaria CBS 119925]